MVVELFSPDVKLANIYDIVEDTSNIVQTFTGLRDNVDYHLKVSVFVSGISIRLVEDKPDKIGKYKAHIKLAGQSSALVDSKDKLDLLTKDQLQTTRSF